MKQTRDEAWVFVDWFEENTVPILVGKLTHASVRGKTIFSFEYNGDWLAHPQAFALDPGLHLFNGPQYLEDEKPNFGIFLDSSPDRWGRLLMRRRELIRARRENRPPRQISELDFLLGVCDMQRTGAIRFKRTLEGDFVTAPNPLSTPPWTALRHLERASLAFEREMMRNDPDEEKWLMQLIAPGSSLGGARPKASVVDNNGALWIAKFPSHSDEHDTGAWEYIVSCMAQDCGIAVPQTKCLVLTGKKHAFISKRFDRMGAKQRLHYASVMTLLGKGDGASFEDGASYLQIAEFIQRYGAAPKEDLKQLWTRIVFNICVSNTDDHLRNHGFLLDLPNGWRLSPAFDVNPNPHGVGLTLGIDAYDNRLDLELPRTVAHWFKLTLSDADDILKRVVTVVASWRKYAEKVGLVKMELESMAPAFAAANKHHKP